MACWTTCATAPSFGETFQMFLLPKVGPDHTQLDRVSTLLARKARQHIIISVLLGWLPVSLHCWDVAPCI